MLPIVLISLFSPFVAAAAGIASSSWREPSFIYNDVVRSHQTFAALSQAMNVLHTPGLQFDGQNYEYFAHTLGQMAEVEFTGNSTSFSGVLVDYFQLSLKSRANFEDTKCVDYALAYGYAAARAYFTLHNATFLQYAVQSWEWANGYTIAEDRNLPIKSPRIAANCSDLTMAGGTFATTTASDPTVGSRATGYFTLLSSMLAQATSNATYLAAAVRSATFIHNHLWDPIHFVPQDSIAADSCIALDATLNSYNAALLLESLAVLSAITQNSDRERVDGLLNGLIVAVLDYTGWQTVQGIITNGADKVGDGLLVRALAWAYVYNATTTDTRGYVHDYIAVQYNALLELATSNTTTPAAGATSNATNIYGGQWTGPSSSP
ncbi:hypothetical protein C8F01DRAFT_194188 [Mycena amicta]|nr:hypothetical protein C8F01DRAFT_194188 [Mycena amicta]